MNCPMASRSRYPVYAVVLMMGCFILAPSMPGAAESYEEVPVINGGTLTGTVTLVGDVPRAKGYSLVTFPDPIYCGRISDGNGWRLLQAFNVGPNGAFQDVVVAIEGIEKGKPFHFKKPRIEAVDCTFNPFTTVVRDRSPVEVVNLDPAMHDIQAYETSHLGPRVLFNRPLPINARHSRESAENPNYKKHFPGEPIEQEVRMTKGRRVFVMQCGFHAYMESWAFVVENPYYDVTKETGGFRIPDIPPGTYRLVVWHPQIGAPKEYDVTIQPNKESTLNIQIEAPKGRLYANESMNEHRFSLSGGGTSQIIPTVELQRY